MKRKPIFVSDAAIHEMRQILTAEEAIALLRRFSDATLDWHGARAKRLICRVHCTRDQWWRYKDQIANMRVFFEHANGGYLVRHALPRTKMTYEVIELLFEADL